MKLTYDRDYTNTFHSLGIEPWIAGFLKNKSPLGKVLDIGCGLGLASLLLKLYLNNVEYLVGAELAIVFGSLVELESFRDVDVAVYASSRELDLDAVIKLSVELEERLHIPVDVVPLDAISPSFRHYILARGKVVLEKKSGLYEALLMQTLDELVVLESEKTLESEASTAKK